jgi:hypothetical protein
MISTTVWKVVVERGSHWDMMRARRVRWSFVLRSRGWSLTFSDLTIFSMVSGLLQDGTRGKEQHWPVKICKVKRRGRSLLIHDDAIVHSPNVVQHELDKHRLQRPPRQLPMTDDPLRLRVEVEVAPKHLPQLALLDLELLGVELSELADPERPAVDCTRKDDVPPLWGKVDVLVVLLFKLMAVLAFLDATLARLDLACERFLPGCQSSLTSLSPTHVVLHSIRGVEASHDGVHTFDELGEVMIGFGGRELELRDESIELVDDEDRTKTVYPGLTKDSDGLLMVSVSGLVLERQAREEKLT